MGLIKRWFVRRALKKAKRKSDVEDVVDEMLKDAMRELQDTGRTADKILKAKLIRQESRHALAKIQELDDEEDDEEEVEENNPQDQIVAALIQKFLGGAPASQPGGQDLAALASQLTPEQIDELKKKFLG